MWNGHDNQNDGASGSYWNADGYSSERGNKNILIENSKASGWTDGGHDHKAENITLRNCVAWDNKRNYRSWGLGNNVLFYNVTSIEPNVRGGSGGKSHIYLDNSSKLTAYGGSCQHNSTGTRSFYLVANANLTLIGVSEIYGPAVSGPNDYIASGAHVYRL